ncbi:MAG: mechanosensitive ion channel domain-containing protein [Caldimonas sp.]
MEFLGIKWVGVNVENGQKLLLSFVFIAAVLVLGALARWATRLVIGRTDHAGEQTRFWTRQAISLIAAIVLVLGLLSIWFNDPTRLTTAFGLMSAGLAFALQQVITAFAGYFVILRGATFTVGDRISMGGVRGDVLQLGFIQTTIMEMGQPPSVQAADPAMWVRSRQFTGRIVTVSNSKIFSEPVFNYTRDFPFIWEEMTIPITYKADRGRVEQILLDAARRHGEDPDTIAADAMSDLQRRFSIEQIDLEPRVFFRITDNWLELTVRFIVGTHRIRAAKDAMSRFIVDELDAAGIGIASATYDIVGFPPLELLPRAR